MLDLGKGTFFDHELGQGGGVLDLIERETGKTGEERLQWLVDEHLLPNGNGGARQVGPGRGHVVHAYPYHDEGGRLLFEVVRFEPKDFRQRRPTRRGQAVGIGPLVACARFPTACQS